LGLERINEIRKKQHVTIEELSIKSGIPLSTVKKVCAGITTNPNLETVRALAHALNSTLDDIAEPEPPKITAAAAHFDLDQLTPEGVERYLEFVEFLAMKYGKK
jgi:transcriptional regulator with XRE-family HTH domain